MISNKLLNLSELQVPNLKLRKRVFPLWVVLSIQRAHACAKVLSLVTTFSIIVIISTFY